jgi:hypothetical protein
MIYFLVSFLPFISLKSSGFSRLLLKMIIIFLIISDTEWFTDIEKRPPLIKRRDKDKGTILLIADLKTRYYNLNFVTCRTGERYFWNSIENWVTYRRWITFVSSISVIFTLSNRLIRHRRKVKDILASAQRFEHLYLLHVRTNAREFKHFNRDIQQLCKLPIQCDVL